MNLDGHDSIDEYYRDKFSEQKDLVDCMFYLCEIVIATGIVFAAAMIIKSFFV